MVLQQLLLSASSRRYYESLPCPKVVKSGHSLQSRACVAQQSKQLHSGEETHHIVSNFFTFEQAINIKK